MDDTESRDAYALLLLESIIRMYCSLKLMVKRFDIRKTRRSFNQFFFHFIQNEIYSYYECDIRISLTILPMVHQCCVFGKGIERDICLELQIWIFKPPYITKKQVFKSIFNISCPLYKRRYLKSISIPKFYNEF